MLRGFATVSFYADEVAAARPGTPNCSASSRTSFDPRRAPPPTSNTAPATSRTSSESSTESISPSSKPGEPGGTVVFWHVDDVQASVDRLLGMGATVYEPIVVREAGFVTASVVDPFGNILGVMDNPHYLEILAATKR